MVNAVEKKKRRYWSEHDMLRKVRNIRQGALRGENTRTVYTTPTSAQRLVFDIFGIHYTYKGKDGASVGQPE
jgi:hypothetical protein